MRTRAEVVRNVAPVESNVTPLYVNTDQFVINLMKVRYEGPGN